MLYLCRKYHLFWCVTVCKKNTWSTVITHMAHLTKSFHNQEWVHIYILTSHDSAMSNERQTISYNEIHFFKDVSADILLDIISTYKEATERTYQLYHTSRHLLKGANCTQHHLEKCDLNVLKYWSNARFTALCKTWV